MTYANLFTILLALSLVGCVSQSKYKNLTTTHQEQEEEFNTVRRLLADTQLECNKLKDEYATLETKYEEQVKSSNASTEELQAELEALEKSSNEIIAQKDAQLASFVAKEEKELLDKNQRLANTKVLKDSIAALFATNIEEGGWDVFQEEMTVKIIIPRYFIFREKGSSIQKIGIKVIANLVQVLESNTDRMITIKTRSDRDGIEENWERSVQRAGILGEQLIEAGIDMSRIETKGDGGMPDTYDKSQKLLYPIEFIIKFKS